MKFKMIETGSGILGNWKIFIQVKNWGCISYLIKNHNGCSLIIALENLMLLDALENILFDNKIGSG